MKKSVFTLILLGAFSVVMAQKSTQTVSATWIKNTAKFNYTVKNNGNQYDFIVDSLTLGNSIAFRWKMGAPKNYQGKVRMSKSALDTASYLVNTFRNKDFLDLTDKTSVWMGRKVRQMIAIGKPISINAGTGREVFSPMGEKSYTFILNGTSTTLKCLYIESASGKKIWFLNDVTNPLIIKMDLGWTIELMSVESN